MTSSKEPNGTPQPQREDLASSPDAHAVPNRDVSGEGAVFHIVGIGASAGGLEALEVLFSALPSDTGAAFVVIQHLSPDFESHMQQLLSRHTQMPVRRVENGVRVEPDNVYLIPPRMEMVISDGKLLLTEKSEDRGLSLPIDQFFRSLASDRTNKAVGVILSGTGSDGSRGIRHIHELGGLVVAQDPHTCKFDGMPLSAQATGVVDLLLAPTEIAEAISRYVTENATPDSLVDRHVVSREGLAGIFHLLQGRYGIDFSQYKLTTVARRLQRRLDIGGFPDVGTYLANLPDSPAELNELYRDLLIGVTKFFRDPEAFAVLQEQIIPGLLDRAVASNGGLRIWIAGCATGEEAYSIAILLDEAVRLRRRTIEVKVFATDVHHVSLNVAAQGIYDETAVAELSAERRARYFRKVKEGYQVTRELRRYIVFAPHNLINDPPFTQMDLVSCRNLLIYLQPGPQRKVMSLFHFALKSAGILFLGPSESPGDFADEFVNLDKKWRFFRKLRDVRLPAMARGTAPSAVDMRSPPRPVRAATPRASDWLRPAYDRLLEQRMPESILVGSNWDVLHCFGGAEQFLRPRAGRASSSIIDQAVEGLRAPLRGILQHAYSKRGSVQYTGIRFGLDGVEREVNLVVEPVESDLGTTFLVEFVRQAGDERPPVDEVVNVAGFSSHRIEVLEGELRLSQENLQATIEEMETSNEELQATNEELTAANEELQSTNEELHSVNEELYTVNAEHQSRLEELARANDDMDNLLATTRVGVIFLDDDLCIRRYTPEIARLFHLVPQDIGRSIAGFAHHLRNADLLGYITEVLHADREKEASVEDRHGGHFLLRILPYRSGANARGVVMTLIDVTGTHETRRELERFKHVAETAPDMMALFDRQWRILYANPAFAEGLGYTRDRIQEQYIWELHPSFVKDLERLQTVQRYETELLRRDGRTLPVEITISPVERGAEPTFAVNARDISERVALIGRLEEMGKIVEASHDALIITDADGRVTSWNQGATDLYGYSSREAIGAALDQLVAVSEERADATALQGQVDCVSQLTRRRKTGGTVVVSSRRQSIRVRGELERVLHIDRDISEQKRVERELLVAKEEAQRANEAKSAFLANISHELRTPMTAILGFVDILAADLKVSENLEKLGVIKRNGEYLLSILNDILDLSKIEAGKTEIQTQPVDLAAFMAEVKELKSLRAGEGAVPLHFEYETRLPTTVTMDGVRVRQILVNLIGNALKFTDDGEVRVSVALSEGDKPELRFVVTDTGIGMDASTIDTVFTPFSQASQTSARRYGGTGLGLSISKRLAESMGGTITVQSTKGKGSCFTLKLPLTRTDLNVLDELVPPVSVRLTSPGELPQLNAKVLVADDRRDVWRVAKHYLECAGCRVTVVEDGLQAVEAVCTADAPFDLIFMDIQMPVMNGRDATIELRRRGYTTPIVALTAGAMEAERESCLSFGCTAFVPKPIDGKKLIETAVALMVDRAANDVGAAPRVLVVDDSEDAAAATALLLGRKGIETAVANSGNAAFVKVAEFRPSVILLDLGLPDLDGMVVARNLRRDGYRGRIVAVSGRSDERSKKQALSSGMDHYLLKPCDFQELLSVLQVT